MPPFMGHSYYIYSHSQLQGQVAAECTLGTLLWFVFVHLFQIHFLVLVQFFKVRAD